jgi:transcriptional regulator with XRE-family HTH domain
MEIGSHIKALLAFKGIKQKDLAKYLGVTDNTISYFCSGSRVPNAEQIIKIAEYLEVSADYILGINVKRVKCRRAKNGTDKR